MAFFNRIEFPSDALTTTEVIWVQTGTSGIFLLKEGSAPSTVSGYSQIYAKSSDHQVYYKDSLGAEHVWGSGGGGTPASPDTSVQFNNGGVFGGTYVLYTVQSPIISLTNTSGIDQSSFEIVNIDNGGRVSIAAGNNISVLSHGGDIALYPGAGTAMNGNVFIADPVSSYSAIFDTSLLATSDKTYQLPNKDGIFAMLSDIPGGSGAGELAWVHQTGTSLQLDNSTNIYINIGVDNAGLVTITLPTNANSTAGKTFSVTAMGSGGWKIAQNALQKIHFGNQNTTTGVPGYLASSNQYDSLKLICAVGDGASNAEWVVMNSVGNIIVA